MVPLTISQSGPVLEKAVLEKAVGCIGEGVPSATLVQSCRALNTKTSLLICAQKQTGIQCSPQSSGATESNW